MKSRPELGVRLAHPNQLHDYFIEAEPCGGVFLPGYDEVPAGAEVVVSIRFPQDQFKFLGKVLWRRTQRGGGGRGLVRGVGIMFNPDQAEAVTRMLAHASEPRVSVSKRQSRRLPLSIKVRYNSRFSLNKDLVRDLSLGGLRVLSAKPPAVGSQVVIYLTPPRAFTAIRIVGEVVWRQLGETPSFGVKFTETSPKDKRRIARLLWDLDGSET